MFKRTMTIEDEAIMLYDHESQLMSIYDIRNNLLDRKWRDTNQRLFPNKIISTIFIHTQSENIYVRELATCSRAHFV